MKPNTHSRKVRRLPTNLILSILPRENSPATLFLSVVSWGNASQVCVSALSEKWKNSKGFFPGFSFVSVSNYEYFMGFM